VVVGGGLIGTSIAWRLGQAGLAVAVVTGEPAAAASLVAAGMLAAASEATYTDQALMPLKTASLRRYADFAAELESATGLPAGLRQAPTLSVGYDADDAARLRTFADFLDRTGIRCERLTGRDCRSYEPLLAPAIRSGLLIAEDWSCDNRLLLRAVGAAARQVGVAEVAGFVHAVTSRDGQVTGVELADGSTVVAQQVVIANGAWAAQIAGIPTLPVRPVKGQILRLDPGRLACPSLQVRAFTKGSEVYLVPRSSGREVVVGATVEELGFDHRVTAGGVYELLRDARTVLPLTSEYTLTETTVGWRPGTPDNAPILGRCELDGLLLATGHYRNGVLLTPITAEVIARLVISGELDPLAAGFGLDRFAPVGEPIR
jgi:glycine oxidase